MTKKMLITYARRGIKHEGNIMERRGNRHEGNRRKGEAASTRKQKKSRNS